MGCEELEFVEIPASVKFIGSDAFWFCKKLKELRIPESCIIGDGGTLLFCDAKITRYSASNNPQASTPQNNPQQGQQTTTSYDFNPGLYPNGGLIIDNSFNGGTSIQTEIQQPVRQPQRQWCRTCGGTGTCNTCGGSGWVHRTGIGHDSYCPNCPNHNGKCPWCNGRGEWYE